MTREARNALASYALFMPMISGAPSTVLGYSNIDIVTLGKVEGCGLGIGKREDGLRRGFGTVHNAQYMSAGVVIGGEIGSEPSMIEREVL